VVDEFGLEALSSPTPQDVASRFLELIVDSDRDEPVFRLDWSTAMDGLAFNEQVEGSVLVSFPRIRRVNDSRDKAYLERPRLRRHSTRFFCSSNCIF
jgi:hypothetical protein